MKSMRPPQRRLNKSREEARKLIQNSTKLKMSKNQPPLKLTLLPRLSPPLKRNPKSLIKNPSKRPLIPPRKKLNLLKLEPKKPDLRRPEKERDVEDSSHQFSAHSRSSKN